MEKNQVTITHDQWLDTVDKWIDEYLIITHDELYEIRSKGHTCGFCDAQYIVTDDPGDDKCIQYCPAAPEICTNFYGIHFPHPTIYRAYHSLELSDRIQAALEILQWIHDFGRLAHWKYTV
jgi:hypothetical protein